MTCKMTRKKLKEFEILIGELQDARQRIARMKQEEFICGYGNLLERDACDVLLARQANLAHLYTAQALEVASWIDGVPDPVARRALRLRYIDGLSWLAVSHRMGYTTEAGARMAVERFLHNLVCS